MLTVEDLEAVLEDLEDICARLPKNFHFEYRITLPTPDMRLYALYFNCAEHKYYLATLERGIAEKTRVVTREQFLRRYERYLHQDESSLYFFGE